MMGAITSFLDREEKGILREVDVFQKTLTHLKYEGKVSRGKNIKAADSAATCLAGTLRKHRRLQEGVVFPYLLMHIPKHESLIQFLRSDHQDIRKNKEKLCLSLKKILKNSKHTNEDWKVQQTGIYLTCLVRHHMELEKRGIHEALKKELRPDEKREVRQRIRKWIQKHER